MTRIDLSIVSAVKYWKYCLAVGTMMINRIPIELTSLMVLTFPFFRIYHITAIGHREYNHID